MVVSIFLARADMFQYLGSMLSWKSRGSKDLLFRVCLVTAVASALFTNDTCCVVLTEFVLELAAERNLPAKPFLLALATSANIGSSATPIGIWSLRKYSVRRKSSSSRDLAGPSPEPDTGSVLFLLAAAMNAVDILRLTLPKL